MHSELVGFGNFIAPFLFWRSPSRSQNKLHLAGSITSGHPKPEVEHIDVGVGQAPLLLSPMDYLIQIAPTGETDPATTGNPSRIPVPNPVMLFCLHANTIQADDGHIVSVLKVFYFKDGHILSVSGH